MKRRRGNPWAPAQASSRFIEAQREQQAQRALERMALAPAPVVVETPPPRKGRQPNKTEQRWLTRLAADPTVKSFHYEGVTVRLSDGRRYTPDVFVEYADGSLGLDEIKGAFVRDTAPDRFEWARQRYPGFRWRWCQWVSGEWRISTTAGRARLTK